jgi:hypothetical protein
MRVVPWRRAVWDEIPEREARAETGVPEGSTMRRVLAAMAIGMGVWAS